MSKGAFIAVVFAAILVTSSASGQESRVTDAELRLEQTMTRLALSDEQREALAPVLENSRSAQQEILASYGIDVEKGERPAQGLGMRNARAMKRKLDAVRADTLKTVSGILSADQLEEFKRIQAERQAEMQARIRRGR
jgi:hypothetical protein